MDPRDDRVPSHRDRWHGVPGESADASAGWGVPRHGPPSSTSYTSGRAAAHGPRAPAARGLLRDAVTLHSAVNRRPQLRRT
ncbi:hypothetical protein GCM10022402_17000 [Salinactinospora qingdaonensis]|uniref:Uncharacterized protein n=1 Tax=Salinactinospora qingdaonensis TaxID=702744 RepID=A0ABP7FE74_9ACTN